MKNINEVEANEIDIKPFKVKDKLNPDFFNDEGQLNSQIRLRLLDIADDFVKSLEVKWVKPSDIVLTGSIANYNWSKYSDVDIHIIYNFKDVYNKTDFVKDYFNSKRDIWNDTHEGLTIKDLPVEISVEDSSNPAKSTGVYSLEKNKWVKEPEDMNDSELNKEYIKDFCAKQMTKFDELFDEIDNETDRKKLEILSNKVEALYEKLKNMRGEALKSKEKEMATGNIIWKVIKHQGYIEQAWEYINKVYDRRNTIDEDIKGRIVRVSKKQLRKINEVLDRNLFPKFGSVAKYFRMLNNYLQLKGENELFENDPKDKQAVCACLAVCKVPKIEKQIREKGCVYRDDLIEYLGNYQNRNNLRNGIIKFKNRELRKNEYNNEPLPDYTPEASNMNNFINTDDVSSINESLCEVSDIDNIMCDIYDNGEMSPEQILISFKNKRTKTQDWNPLIKPLQYQNALRQYMQYGDAMRFPEETVDEWLHIIIVNTMRLKYDTDYAGHSRQFPTEEFIDVLGEEYNEWCEEHGVDNEEDDFNNYSEFLEEIGFYDWLKLPDGSDAWSDYGLDPLFEILSEYRSDMPVGEKLILVNRCLDVYHCRGNLSSAFIGGGDNTLTKVSNNELFENIHRVNEAAMPQFNLQTLSSIKSFAGKLKYCKQMLGPSFGSGSSRIIFEIDDNKVLKLAKNQKGLAQNEFEEETSRYGDMVVKVFECADDYSWLVEENCVPAKEKDFEQILGLPFETYCDLVRYYFNRYCRRGKEANTYTLSPIECDKLIKQLYEQNEDGFIPRLFNLMGDYQLPWGDLTRISTYGMVNRDGETEIVVIDSGLSEEILDTYYRKH